MNKNVLFVLAATAAAASPLLADPMETHAFAGPYSVYVQGNPANTTLSASFTGSGYAPGGVTIVMDMTAIAPGTLVSDVTVTVTPPVGDAFDVSMGDPDVFGGISNVTRTVQLMAGTDPVGTWTFRISDASQQGDGVAPEASLSNVRLSLETAATPAFVTDMGPLAPGETQLADEFHGAGSTNWFKFTIPALDDVAAPRYLDITTQGTFADSYIGLYDNNGRLRAVDDDSGTSHGSFLSFGYGGGSTVGGGGPSDTAAYSDGRSGKLSAGTYWLAVSEYGGGQPVFGPGWNVQPPPEGAGFSYTLTFNLGTAPGGGSPPSATPFGTLAFTSSETTASQGAAVLASDPSWFSFTTAAVSSAAGTYLDITLNADSSLSDAEMGLYTASGVLAGIDDDDGAGFTPFLSFGSGGGSTTGDNDVRATVSDGRDGNLTAGTYYLAVGEYNSTFRNAFNVTVQFGGEGGGGGVAHVDIRTGHRVTGCGPADVGGTGGVPGADGHLDNNDFIVYIDTFFAHAPAADVGSTGGVPGHDGAWDNNDFVVFIDQFFAGC
jgi:hypothetical protein